MIGINNFFLKSSSRSIPLVCHWFSRRMPHVNMISNVQPAKFPSNFDDSFIELIARSLGKPINSVSLVVTPGARLTQGSYKQTPTCLIVVKAIGSFSQERNIKYSEAISKFMKEQLEIEPEHCVIQFMNMEPENVSICGTTVKELNSK